MVIKYLEKYQKSLLKEKLLSDTGQMREFRSQLEAG